MLDIVFFDHNKGSKFGNLPRLTISPAGQVQLSPSATGQVKAEAGASANLCYSNTRKAWLLAYWPDGKKGQPTLGAGKSKNVGTVNFSSKVAVTQVFERVKPDPNRKFKSIGAKLLPEALTDPAHPEARFYQLDFAA